MVDTSTNVLEKNIEVMECIMEKRTRDKRITFRMTENEFIEFRDKVEKSKLTQNEFMLKCITEKDVIVIDDLKEVLIELKRLGSNINQIAKGLNTYHGLEVSDDIRDIKNELFKITDTAIEVLKVVNK